MAHLELSRIQDDCPTQTAASSVVAKLSSGTWVAKLNLMHPCPIQILGPAELECLDGMQTTERQAFQTTLFATDIAALVITDNLQTPSWLLHGSIAHQVSLFTTPKSSQHIMHELSQYLSRIFEVPATLHGVLIEVLDVGVFITGDPGVGKSELALELISRGHRLIADDSPCFRRIGPNAIEGRCPKVLQDFLEVRALGVLNIRAMYGDAAVLDRKRLSLIIDLKAVNPPNFPEIERLNDAFGHRPLLGTEVAELTLPVAPGRNLAVMVEAAVRNFLLKQRGYHAPKAFSKAHANCLRALKP